MMLGENPLSTLPARPAQSRRVDQSALISDPMDFGSFGVTKAGKERILGYRVRVGREQEAVKKAAPETEPFAARLTGPAKFMKLVAERWQLNDDDASKLFGLANSGEFRSVVDNLVTLVARPDIRERVRIALDVRSRLGRYLQDNRAAEISWLNEFRGADLEATPIELIRSGRLADLYRVYGAVFAYFGR
jgi:hypothetical protein